MPITVKKVKICPTCRAENISYATLCTSCNTDISQQAVIEKQSYNQSEQRNSSLAGYIRMLGWTILILSVISALYLVFNFSYTKEILILNIEKRFTFLGITYGFTSLLSGMFIHAVALGIAALLDR